MRLLLLLLAVLPMFSQGVAYTFNSTGILTLSYNGQSFNGSSMDFLFFNGSFGGSTVTFSTSAKSAQASGFTVRYNSGIAGDTSFVVVLSGAGTDTFGYQLCVNNNDTLSRTLTNLSPDRIFSMNTPTTATIASDSADGYTGWGPYGTATLVSWATGTYACYQDTYGDIMFKCAAASGTPGKLLANIDQIYGGSNAGIAAGASYCSTLKITFGTTSSTIAQLAAPGYLSWIAKYPQIANIPNRNPVAQILIADGTKTATNPRGYQSGSMCDWFTGFAACRTSILGKLQTYLNSAALIVPRARIVILWDLEGQEFNQFVTYVGYPGDTDIGSMFQYLAPEMEQTTNGVPLADEMYQKIRDNGFEPAITLRPSRLQVGSGAPTTACFAQTSATNGYVYIDYASTAYSNRGYECEDENVTVWDDTADTVACAGSQCILLRSGTSVQFYNDSGSLPAGIVSGQVYGMCNADNTAHTFQVGTDIGCGTLVTDFSGASGTQHFEWWQGPLNPAFQALSIYTETIDVLRKKITYAYNRWGIRTFYIDSTFYCLTGGNRCLTSEEIHNDMWNTLLAEFPGFIFMPENGYGGQSTMLYQDTTNGVYGRLSAAWRSFPQMFNVVKIGSGGNYNTFRTFIQSQIASGEVYMVNVQGGVASAPTTTMMSDYALAKTTNSLVVMTDSSNGGTRTFKSDPGNCREYQCVARVYFASTANNLAASTTYCTTLATTACYLSGVLQSTAALNLSALGYWQLRYYDYAGNLVSNPGTSAQLR